MAHTLTKMALSIVAIGAGVALVLRNEVSGILGIGECSDEIAAISGDPVEAADAAVERGDIRLLAVAGYR